MSPLSTLRSLIYTTGLLIFLCCTNNAHAASTQAKIGKLSDTALQEALRHRGYRFGRSIKGGAHTNGSWSGGSLPALALAGYAGNEQAAAECIKRMQYLLKGENAPTATGGYPAQHELLFAGSAVILKNNPKLWALFSAEEHEKIELIIKSLLVASAYTTSDINHENNNKPTNLHGGGNQHRGWNPNFREGMLGMLLVAGCYLGPEEAQSFLDSFDHNTFVSALKKAQLTNVIESFTFNSIDNKAPTGTQIEKGVRNFRYLGNTIHDPMAIYEALTRNTFGKNVHAGINNGKGIKGAGKIASGAEGLPNIGKPGMLLEFDSRDGGGVRSSAGYASHGFRPNLINQAALICSGYWKHGKIADELVALIDVGATDLHYKLKHGYKDYSKGKVHKNVIMLDDSRFDHRLVHALWEDVLKPYHQQADKEKQQNKKGAKKKNASSDVKAKQAKAQIAVDAQDYSTFLSHLQQQLDAHLTTSKRQPRFHSSTFQQEVSINAKSGNTYKLHVPKMGSSMSLDIFKKMKKADALSLCKAIADKNNELDHALLSYFYYMNNDSANGSYHLSKAGEHKSMVTK